MKTTISSIISVLIFVLFAVSGSGQSWDIASGYSGVRNPNGVWSFGRKWSVDASGMDLLTVKWGRDGWYMAGTGGSPSIMHLNWSSSMPGPFLWNADNSHGYCTVRWTCPASGRYVVNGEFYAADSRGMDSYVYLVINGSIRFSNRIQSTTQSTPFSENDVQMKQGDFVDFVIVWGGDGNPGTSSVTGVGATIARAASAATATATVVNGFLVGVNLTANGLGYTNAPDVRFIGGGGSGARGQASVSNGAVTAVEILNPGSGYTNAPIVVIAPPFVPPPVMQMAPLSLVSFSNLTEGTTYQIQSIEQGQFVNLGGVFTATNPAFTLLTPGLASSNSHRLAAVPVPVQAQATPQVAGGFVVGATLTSGGSGYGTTIPDITILNNGAGSNATAVATVSEGVVVGITITDPGIGYVNGARMIIAAPPTVELRPQGVSWIAKLELTELSPYENYRIQFAPTLNEAWREVGDRFTPTASEWSRSHEMVGEAGFFRVVHEP